MGLLPMGVKIPRPAENWGLATSEPANLPLILALIKLVTPIELRLIGKVLIKPAVLKNGAAEG